MRCLEIPDATRVGNSAASSPTLIPPRSARRAGMNSSLELGNRALRNERSQPVQHPVSVGATFVVLDNPRPAGLADAGEAVVDEGDLGPSVRRREEKDKARGMGPA